MRTSAAMLPSFSTQTSVEASYKPNNQATGSDMNHTVEGHHLISSSVLVLSEAHKFCRLDLFFCNMKTLKHTLKVAMIHIVHSKRKRKHSSINTEKPKGTIYAPNRSHTKEITSARHP